MDEARMRELVARARRGGAEGREAFRQLVAEQQSEVLRLLYYILGSQEDAEEVFQETWLRAYRHLDRLRDDARFGLWVRRIATRLAFNWMRDASTRRRHQRAVPASSWAPAHNGVLVAADVLEKVLAQLPFAYREVLILRYVDELALSEIAEVLDIGLSAAKMRLKRARDAFWQQYRELDAEAGGDDGGTP